MAKYSAGILLYRVVSGGLEVFLVHPGGPFFRNKDIGWWSIPKGELMKDEDPLGAALREFEEETGYVPEGDFVALAAVVQKGGKRVECWAVKGDVDPKTMTCNTFALEWPPGSGKMVDFPEVDKGEWFSLAQARTYINDRQRDFLDQLEALFGLG